MKRLLLAAAATGLVGTANAQSAFEGFYGQIATGYQNNSVASSTFTANDGGPFPVNAPSQNNGTMPLMLGLGYNFSVSPQFLLGLGAEYQAISSTSGTTTFGVNGGCGGPCPGAKYKASNQYSIFVTPGYVIDKDKLAYLKAGYSSQNLKSTYQAAVPTDTDGGASFGSSNVSGYILGLGYKQIITGGFYGFAEGNYYSYGKASFNNTLPGGTTISGYNPSSSAYNFLVGVGYRF